MTVRIGLHVLEPQQGALPVRRELPAIELSRVPVPREYVLLDGVHYTVLSVAHVAVGEVAAELQIERLPELVTREAMP